MNEKTLLTCPDVAGHLSISLRQVQRLIAGGELQAVHIGGSVRVTQQSLDHYVSLLILAERQRRPPEVDTNA